MPCETKTVSTNVTGLSICEEECPGELPVTRVWYNREPNSYSDFGDTLTQIAREPISQGRQNQKGVVTDLEAALGWNEDFTRSNFYWLLQGLFCANAREKGTTSPLNGSPVAITAVDATDNEFQAASGLGVFAAGDLIRAEGFSIAANNGLKTVVTASATAVEVVETLVAEASPPTAARLTTVGRQFASADLSVVVSGGIATIASAASNLPNLVPGEWVAIGGDTTNSRFANNEPGYFRVRSVNGTSSFVVDAYTLVGGGTLVSDSGTGRTIQMFIGDILRNEADPSNQVFRTYTAELTMGEGVSSVQGGYISGAAINEFTINLPGQDKVNVDLAFVATDSYWRRGEPGSELEPGTHIPALKEPAIDTSNDMAFAKLSVNSDSSTQDPLFTFAADLTITVSNNITPNKALGVLGALDLAYGNFTATVSGNAYFDSVEVFEAMRNSLDVSFTGALVSRSRNFGWIFDLPLITLSGSPTLEKDAAIQVAIEGSAAESKFGTTFQAQRFSWIPSILNPE